MTWILFSFLSAITAAGVTIFAKIGVQKLDSTLATTIRTAIMAFFLICISLAMRKFSHVSLNNLGGKEVVFLLLSALAGALSLLFYFAALKSGDAGKVAIIDRTSLIFITFFSVAFFKEKIDVLGIVGIVFVVVGAALVSFR